ncbi:MAG: nucleotidyl transferase AbiEii/AbiGii toxin family protein [Parafilimonas sp.]
MYVPELKDFSLVGGTVLALKYGHRTSIDLDLFNHLPFENKTIIKGLESKFGTDFNLQISREKFGVFGFIKSVKVDIVKHSHPLISNIETIDDIRTYGIPDIAAMKINAILGRGKKKDFWDIFELLHYFSLQELIEFYYKKFPNQMLLIGIPYALIYFTNAEESDEPVSLKGQTWGKVKKFIQKKVRDYLR